MQSAVRHHHSSCRSAALTHSAPPDPTQFEPDPIYVSGLREGGWILLMWVCCFVWTLVVCLSQGYPDSVDPGNFPTVFGIPAWVAWGIAFPWLVADGVTIWFCLTQMEDADLGADPDPADEASARGRND